ncbi:hypothetical protein NDU88_001060 [Pleurodeles waltl]|uniref:Uncharacterized protein n=1 Tax=Pleurodeles waltl TaxID=8319 RepID=A0AAV7Q2X9_PLEWA|nr:hypothetical protein NDU88_001060 [Pleurodeles waltl]
MNPLAPFFSPNPSHIFLLAACRYVARKIASSARGGEEPGAASSTIKGSCSLAKGSKKDVQYQPAPSSFEPCDPKPGPTPEMAVQRCGGGS